MLGALPHQSRDQNSVSLTNSAVRTQAGGLGSADWMQQHKTSMRQNEKQGSNCCVGLHLGDGGRAWQGTWSPWRQQEQRCAH